MKRDNGNPEPPSPTPRIETRLAHMGRSPDDHHGFINTPVIRGSTILFENAAQMRGREATRYSYGLTNTPLIESLTTAMTELEGAAGSVVLPSGLAAVNFCLDMAFRPGCRMLIPDNVYFPIRRYADFALIPRGVDVAYYDPMDVSAYGALLNENTACVLIEAPGSITFEFPDIATLVAGARSVGALSIMDNTWATPLIYRPLEHGIDFSVQAGTKYIGGHSDLLIGTIATHKDLWPTLQRLHMYAGQQGGTEEIWLTLRGLRTLDIRMARQQESGLIIAKWLKDRAEVSRLLHPAFPDCPGHENWAREFGRSCGLFGFVLNGTEAMADAFFNQLKLFGLGASWGGYESLAITADLGKSRTARPWIEGPVIRLNVGLEHTDDLIADLDQAFSGMAAAAD